MKDNKKKPNIFERMVEWFAKEAEEHSDPKPTKKLGVDKEIERIKRRVPGS